MRPTDERVGYERGEAKRPCRPMCDLVCVFAIGLTISGDFRSPTAAHRRARWAAVCFLVVAGQEGYGREACDPIWAIQKVCFYAGSSLVWTWRDAAYSAQPPGMHTVAHPCRQEHASCRRVVGRSGGSFFGGHGISADEGGGFFVRFEQPAGFEQGVTRHAIWSKLRLQGVFLIESYSCRKLFLRQAHPKVARTKASKTEVASLPKCLTSVTRRKY